MPDPRCTVKYHVTVCELFLLYHLTRLLQTVVWEYSTVPYSTILDWGQLVALIEQYILYSMYDMIQLDGACSLETSRGSLQYLASAAVPSFSVLYSS